MEFSSLNVSETQFQSQSNLSAYSGKTLAELEVLETVLPASGV